jgi:hypothetical protein
MEDMRQEILQPNGWNTTTMYEVLGDDPSYYPCNVALNRNNVFTFWIGLDQGAVLWNGHGNYSSVVSQIKYGSRTADSVFFQNSEIPSLDDAHPSIVFQNACSNGRPEQWHMQQKLLRRGAVAVIGATRTSWFWRGPLHKNDHGVSFFQYRFTRNMSQYWIFGSALYYSKLEYNTQYHSMGEDWMNLFDFNLAGDPYCYNQQASGVEQNEVISGHLEGIISLSQSRPNPARGLATISFQLPKEEKAELEIFNVSGRFIRTLVNATLKPGVYKYIWDGKDQQGIRTPSGVYFYRLKGGGQTLTRKLVLIR